MRLDISNRALWLHAIPIRFRRTTASLGRDQRGISMVEFGLCLPFLVAVGMTGIEITNMASASMQVSQIAVSVADNASRLGQTDNSAVAPSVGEADVDAVMFGAMRQGASLDFQQNGRIILSSLEVDPADPAVQYIHWQRCAGDMSAESSYGIESDEVDGIGSQNLTANPGQAVMFAEVYYTYQPVFAGGFGLVDNMTFRQEAAFIVRDDRDIDDGLMGTPTSTCS